MLNLVLIIAGASMPILASASPADSDACKTKVTTVVRSLLSAEGFSEAPFCSDKPGAACVSVEAQDQNSYS